jgi:hypothetical protein
MVKKGGVSKGKADRRNAYKKAWEYSKSKQQKCPARKMR